MKEKKKNEQEKVLEVAPPGFETAPQLPPAQIKISEVSYHWAMLPMHSKVMKINSIFIYHSHSLNLACCIYHEVKLRLT